MENDELPDGAMFDIAAKAAERELAGLRELLEEKLGLSGKPDEGPRSRPPGGLDEPLGGAGVPAPVVPPPPSRPAGDAKPLPPK